MCGISGSVTIRDFDWNYLDIEVSQMCLQDVLSPSTTLFCIGEV